MMVPGDRGRGATELGEVTDDAAKHWEGVYARQDPEQVSWFEPEPARSLALIESAGLPRDAAILDIGGGASRLAARLAAGGYTDITVADISSAALEQARAQAASVAEHITWIEADIRRHRFTRRYDLWHDRAVFHFMVSSRGRDGYLAVLRRTLRRGGHLILATFGPQGPQQCSGLPTARYDARELAAVLGSAFTLVSSGLETHRTPASADQQFLYAHFVHGHRPGPAISP
jgi:ubiquinone/menaquinone biosynthesis C-methylase UbiE